MFQLIIMMMSALYMANMLNIYSWIFIVLAIYR